MSTPIATSEPNPGFILQTLCAFQQTYALKGAIELGIFTHIAGGATTVAALARQARASERGTRILCDYLTVLGYLTKTGETYGLSPTAAVFLNRNSPAYLGTAANFLAHEYVISLFRDVAGLVRHGGASSEETVSDNNAIWIEFARSMAPVTSMSAKLVAEKAGPVTKALDISSGHGLFALAVARQNPTAHVYALDWAAVLEVARENAVRAGLADRFHTIAGSAFEVDLGSGYDLILLPNFLHHFDMPTCVGLLKRVRAALRPGGKVGTVEFVPNPDRVSPPIAAGFSLQMLGGTRGGDAYVLAEYEAMFLEAGFTSNEALPLAPTPQTLIVSQ